MTEISDRHEALVDRFIRLADGVTDWGAPTPVAEWKARDIVAHLCDWLPPFLHGYGVALDHVSVGDAPVAAWKEHAANVQALLEDQELMDKQVETPQGTQPLAQVLESFYLADVFMHSLDLARASGRDAHLDPVTMNAMVEGMTQIKDQLVASGQFGTPMVLDESHPLEARLMAITGRDPNWTAAR